MIFHNQTVFQIIKPVGIMLEELFRFSVAVLLYKIEKRRKHF